MGWLRLLRRGKRYRESADDVNFHLDAETEDNIARGMTPDDARAAALRKFGNPGNVREEIYLMNSIVFVESIWSDARHTLRTIRRSPGPASVAILTIAIAIGVTTAIFSIVNAILLQAPPYKDPDRLVMLWNLNEKQGYTYADVTSRRGESMSPAEFLDWKRDSGIFSGVAAFNTTVQLITDTDQPQLVKGYALAEGSFQVLGIQTLLGRLPATPEERPGSPNVLLLRYDFWQSRFHSDPNVVGKTIRLYGRPSEIIGVLPPGFIFFNREFEFLTVLPFDERMARARSDRGLRVMARLKQGMTIEEAQSRAQQFSAEMARKYPQWNADWHVRVVTVREDTAGNLRPAMTVLLGALACILLIMCANIANLLLVQASARSKEFAVRAALGAGRWRLIRHILGESLALSFAGGILGMALAYGLVGYFQSMLPDRYFHGRWLIQVDSIRVTWPVVLFGFGAALLTGIAVAIIPALRASRPNFSPDMSDAGRGASGSLRAGRLRNSLVVSEVALGLVLVIGASLLVRSFVALAQRGAGLSGDGILTFQLTIPNSDLFRDGVGLGLKGPDLGQYLTARVRTLNDQLLAGLAAIPGVRAAAGASDLPMHGWFERTEFSIEGRAPASAGDAPLAVRRVVTPDFFTTLNIPLRRGRFFDRTDSPDAPSVVLINDRIAEQYFPNEDPIGKHLRMGPLDGHQPWMTIVGVVGSIREAGIDKPAVPEYYRSQTQIPLSTLYIVLKTSGVPMAVMPEVRRVVGGVYKDIPIYSAREMSAIIRDSSWQLNYSMILLSGLGGLALLLAVIGLFGVLSHSVRERTREIGVRLALGANTRDVYWMVLRKGLILVLLGVGIGLLTASGLTRFLSAMLFGVGVLDWRSFGMAAVLLLAAGAAAALLPALRATHIQPVEALREQ